MITELENMRKRLNYYGGDRQQSRMINDKLRSLKSALLYSYQAGTMQIDNKEYDEDDPESLEYFEFRCLMNPDKLTYEADKKMLSVPFEDICLNAPRKGKTSEGIVPVPVAAGETFIWKETGSRWLVTLQYLEELAYFRADVRKCFPFPLEIDGQKYWFSSVGENQQTIQWYKKKPEELNKENYARTLYIKRDENTLNYFKRFQIVKLPNVKGDLDTWEVQAVSPNSVDNILIVYVKEYFENRYQEMSEEIQEERRQEEEAQGYKTMYVYDKVKYGAPYIENAQWELKNVTEGLRFDINTVKQDDDSFVIIEAMTGKTGEFDLYYNDTFMCHILVKTV